MPWRVDDPDDYEDNEHRKHIEESNSHEIRERLRSIVQPPALGVSVEAKICHASRLLAMSDKVM